MFGDIARFLLNTVFTLFGAALLLRAWMQVVRMPPYNPVSNAVMQATNWIVLPLRKILPGGKIDWASILAAFIASVVYVVLMVVLAGVDPMLMLPMLLLVAVLTVDQVGAEPDHLDDDPDGAAVVAQSAVARRCRFSIRSPRRFSNPLRRILPRLGGIDLSPILLLVIVQVLLMVVTRVAVSMTLFGI